MPALLWLLAVLLHSTGDVVGEGGVVARRARVDVPPVEDTSSLAGVGEAGEGIEPLPEFDISLEYASAYVFRGYNVFQTESQRDQTLVQRPRLIWTAPGTGLSLGYAVVNQVTGGELAHNVAAGLGAEQDAFVSYEFWRQSPIGVSAELAVVAFPAADAKVAGTSLPLFSSTAAELRYLRSIFLFAGYLHEVRHALSSEDYLYLNPRLEDKVDLSENVSLSLELGAGVKLFSRGGLASRDNMFDVLASATLYYQLTDVLYVGAHLGWAWTNFVAGIAPDTGERRTPRFGDEYVPFWALSVGAEFSREAAAPAVRGAPWSRPHPL